MRPWERQPLSTSATQLSAPSLTTAGPPLPAPPKLSTTPSPPPTFPASAIDQVLLNGRQLTTLLGVTVTDDPSGSPNGLSLDTSSYGTGDHSSQVTPRSCVGVVYTGEHEVYAPAGLVDLKTQTFGSLYGGANDLHLIQQTAAVFPNAADALAFLETAQTQWDACTRGEVQATLSYENGADYALGSVQRQNDVITVSMAKNDGLNGPDACQQALGVRENVVVEARTCETPQVSTAYDPSAGFPKDPDWAVPDAERIVTAMLGNVRG
nr:sensor domain-containing protein [Mycolicibacterium sp. CBMA 334]